MNSNVTYADQVVMLPTVEERLAVKWRWLRIFGLSVVLLVLQGILRGFFYETNDDLLMELLLRGISGAAPVSNLHLYLHGWGQLLVTLYSWAPSVPWYGLLLYTLLYLALVVSFWVIELLGQGRLRHSQMLIIEIVFYGLTYFLHAVQINFTRPALLLGAAAGLLLLTPRHSGSHPKWPVWLLAGLLLAAGWAVRPSGGTLGLLLTLPLVLWQGWGRGIRVVGFLGGLLLVLTGLRTVIETAEVKQYRRNDFERSQLFDYGTKKLDVRTSLDSLAYATLVPYQGINDSVLLNPAFFQRSMQPVSGQGLNIRAYTGALMLALGSLALRMPGCLLLVLAGALVVVGAVSRGQLQARSWQVLAYLAHHIFFGAIVLALASHMPLRVLQPIVTIHVLVNLVLVFGCLLPIIDGVMLPRLQQRWLLGAAIGVGATWLVVNVRLVRQLHRDNLAHDSYLAQLEKEAGPGLLVEQGLYAAYPHLNPLNEHYLQKYRKLVMLTGWLAFDPSQPRLRSAVAGTRDLATALLRVGQQPGTNWVLQPTFAPLLGRYLNQRLALPSNEQVRFELVAESKLPNPASNPPRRFRMVQGTQAIR